MIKALLTPAVRQFIHEHREDNPAQLALLASKYPDIPTQLVAHQVKCYQRAKVKLPTFAETDGIVYPAGVSLEQSSSEATAQYKARLIEGRSLTDLTAGFGIDSYYFSRELEKVVAVEKNPGLTPVVTHNFEVLGVQNITYVQAEAIDYLENESEPTAAYFIDPARRDDANQKLHRIEDCQPNILELVPWLLKRKAEVWVKLSPLLDIHQALGQLVNVSELHVVSLHNECKELLFKCEAAYAGETVVRAVNLTKSGADVLRFTYAEEGQAVGYSEPLRYIYEPNASIMKAGGFKSVARAYGLLKLQRNSHLYTSSEWVDNFPGRGFLLEAVTVLNKKKLKPYLPANKANITVRNYPSTIQEIRKKTSIKDGGSVYLFATTLMDGSPRVLVCTRV
ncbi:hypothetical protein BFP72_16695 [Reichenbachiella sp. 5M10]|uniref:class I SAM-dependent methyltransferase n=1 Tax=Reichenbachiella sp. 5M10 TaxID=1889772 RepID=UPI000C15412D|nr:class I SAM-dependent methyltransferase [Reichenbachiella sp. 5M10]PIB36924.1 hypothetical protein BFP72_16695 [Reichenbachiella sp. 5M10]